MVFDTDATRLSQGLELAEFGPTSPYRSGAMGIRADAPEMQIECQVDVIKAGNGTGNYVTSRDL